MLKTLKYWLLIGSVALMLPFGLFGDVTGSILGVATDPSSAVMQGVRVSATNLDTNLVQEGNSRFSAPDGAGKPPAASTSVQQGSLEKSNSDPIRTTVALIDLQRTAQIMWSKAPGVRLSADPAPPCG